MEPGNYRKINWPAVAVLIALLSLAYSLYWSRYIDQKYLPLSQSQIVFSEESIKVITNSKIPEYPEEIGDVIEFSIKNSGRATARDIQLGIYATTLTSESEKEPFDNAIFSDGEKVAEEWNLGDTRLVHEMYPSESGTFGSIFLGYEIKAISQDKKTQIVVPIKGKDMVFTLHLQYKDELEKNPKNRFFFFHYAVGQSSVYALINQDYKKVYSKLIEYFKKPVDGKLRDGKILEFLENHPPS